MGTSERKAKYRLLGLLGALVLGALLVVVLMGPMPAAQANQQHAGAKKEDHKNKTVQVTAAGKNNYYVRGDGNPIVYKSADSSAGFDGGDYTHVLECPEGYKAIGGGFDLNTPDKGAWLNFGNHWQIQASDPVWADAKIGEAWTVEAYGHTRFFSKKLPTFMAYAACAPEDFISGLFIRYESETADFEKNTLKTIGVSCRRGDRVIGGGFRFNGSNNHLHLVRTERSRDDEHTWQAGA